MKDNVLVFKVIFVNYEYLLVFRKELEYFTNIKDINYNKLNNFLEHHPIYYNYRTGDFSYNETDKISLVGLSRIDGSPIFKINTNDFEDNILNALSLLNNKLSFKKFLRQEKIKAILNDTPIPKLINFGSGDIKIEYIGLIEDDLPSFKI